ncbi:DUF1003 domain-containing protein [Georgenia sp. Z1491]|uniref:DUF1003 domain-containing protein n=1 Tax=Georgenia sp. Z1491 TaxID=3416707 RepID=UPI003CF27CFC
MTDRLDTPTTRRPRLLRRTSDPDRVGRVSESVATFFGTPRFLIYLTVFVVVWLAWNTWGPADLRFDSQEFGFTVLTLMLSLQASYSAPLILLAQNRQVDRDRVSAEQDRQRAERNLTDTEYLTREIASLRMAVGEVATRDFVRSELRDLLADEVADRDRRIVELEKELAGLRGTVTDDAHAPRDDTRDGAGRAGPAGDAGPDAPGRGDQTHRDAGPGLPTMEA